MENRIKMDDLAHFRKPLYNDMMPWHLGCSIFEPKFKYRTLQTMVLTWGIMYFLQKSLADEVTSQLYYGLPTVTRLAPFGFPLDCTGSVDMMTLPEENLTVEE